MAPYLVSQSYAAYRHVCTWSADILQPVFWHTVADLYCHRIRFQAIRKIHSKMDLYTEQKNSQEPGTISATPLRSGNVRFSVLKPFRIISGF